MRSHDELDRLIARMWAQGVRRLYYKVLSENDTGKQQYYLARSYEPLNMLPFGEVSVETGRPDDGDDDGGRVMKAPLRFFWLLDDGVVQAPGAQLVFYPQYPEVRLSGLLRGASGAPRHLMNEDARIQGRVLLLGVADREGDLVEDGEGAVLAYVVEPDDPVAKAVGSLEGVDCAGVLCEIPISSAGVAGDNLEPLLSDLRRIHEEGWIRGARLDSNGRLHICNHNNCGGYTLEAQLGIRPNSRAEADYLGWELKALSSKRLGSVTPRGKVVTLLTPEPTGGIYQEEGVEGFVRRYGYPDTEGRRDRINFSSPHRTGIENAKTNLTMRVAGYDPTRDLITDPSGYFWLADPDGKEVARWDFVELIGHWNDKHRRAVYVPHLTKKEPHRYHYGSGVHLGINTDFGRFIGALFSGKVYYDPGIKMEGASTPRPLLKRRSQFRIKFEDLSSIYERFKLVDLLS